MRRSAWIFIAAVFLPSLGLAWLAVHSVRDQQVVLEHQQAIICQNLTDALAKSIQAKMDQLRDDFCKATQQLLADGTPPQTVAQNFNHKLTETWPMAQLGFAVNLDGEIYSPTPYDSPDARTFRDENDRFLSNRENVEVYTSNAANLTQNAPSAQNAAASLSLKTPVLTFNSSPALRQNADKKTAADLEAKTTIKDLAGNLTRSDLAQEKAKSASAGRAAPMGGTDQIPLPATSPAPLDSLKSTDTDLSSLSQSTPLPESTASPLPAAPPVPAATAAAPAADLPPRATSGMQAPATSAAAPTDASATVTSATQAVPQVTAALGGAAQLNSENSFAKIQRQVIPQQMLTRDTASLSNTVPEESDFRRVIGNETSGELARFLKDKMRLMVWSHATPDAPIVFGAQLDPAKVIETLKRSLQIAELAPDSYARSSNGDICVAILDDTGKPVALSRPDFKGDWKHPFVATEIGEVLPHWEATLYLVDPQAISRAARTLQLTFGLIVLLLVAAIVAGGSLIAADVRRQVRLAQQKTDFVSNVSHELKTPLTSIRMFADLLAEKRVPDEERQATYLRIIAAEASRLTRLINNVLDFARLERGAPPGEPRPCDLVEAVRDVVETCGPHLEASGISFQCEIEAESLPVKGDRDALAQIILNLISNAEKYGGQDILVRVRRQETAAGALGCVDVLDRGAGIPAKEAKTIFEPFHRLDDSLSSGIPGSGLGLTLARRMARADGGDVTYSPRAGGGSCFTLSIPLQPVSPT
jgi:signal transduction histidine kinase